MIYWNLLLGTDDIKSELTRLYKTASLYGLAKHLGVSRTALRRQLAKCGIPIRGRGGDFRRSPKRRENELRSRKVL